jgi:AcrR family transcriptional regulator
MSPASRRAEGHSTSGAARSWAGDPPLREAARERLLEAAARCIARDGMAGAGIAAVAHEAGVSRPTVYRYFEDHQALVEATLFHAGRGLALRIEEQLHRFATPAEKAVEAVCFVLKEIPRDPVLGAMWSATWLDASAVAGITRHTAVAWARHAVKDLVESAGWHADQADEAVEVMLRMLLSLLAAPEPRRSEPALRAFLMRRLVPALGLPNPTRTSRSSPR